MKTIGLLGGMSWESTAAYYRAINEGVGNALGDLHSAKIVIIASILAPSKNYNTQVIGRVQQEYFQGPAKK